MTIVKRSTFSSQDNARWLLSLSEETTEDNRMHWFAICEVLSVHGYEIPEQWEFRPGAISTEDRKENIRRIAEVSKLFLNCGVVTINCFVSPTHEIRQQAKEIIGENDFLEVFINTPIEICEQRDVKGLYKKARAGEIHGGRTGLGVPRMHV